MGAVPNVGLDRPAPGPVKVQVQQGRGLPPSSVGQKATDDDNQRLTMSAGKATPKPQGFGY